MSACLTVAAPPCQEQPGHARIGFSLRLRVSLVLTALAAALLAAGAALWVKT